LRVSYALLFAAAWLIAAPGARAAIVDAKCGNVMLYWSYPEHPAAILPSDDDKNAVWADIYKPDQAGKPVPDAFAECYPHSSFELKDGKVDLSGKTIIPIPRTVTKCMAEEAKPHEQVRFWCE